MLSASEDGTARIWDSRRKKEVHTVTPHKQDSLARPTLGKWLGAASFNDDWLVPTIINSLFFEYNTSI